MRFKIKSQQLAEALVNLVRVIPSKTNITAAECVRISVSDGTTLTLTTSDRDVSAMRFIALDEEGECGTVLVQARLLLDLAKTFPVDMTVEFASAERNVTISWESGRATFPLLEGELEGPKLTGDPLFETQFLQREFAEGIRNTIGSVSDDALRPQLTGVFFDFGTEGANMVATDSRQMVIYNMPDKKSEAPFGFNIHERNLRIVDGCIADRDTMVNVTVHGNGVRFTTAEGYHVTMSLLSGKYPDYRSVIPTDNDSILEADRAELLKALKRIGTCSDKTGSAALKLDLSSDGKAVLSAQNLSFGTSARETLDGVTYRGESFHVGLKGSMLSELLGTLTCEKVQLCLKGERRPVLVVPVQEGNRVFTGLVMPVLVK